MSGQPVSAGDARAILSAAGVPFAAYRQVYSVQGAQKAWTEIGPAVALKSAAGDIAHKSDAGCVALHLNSRAAIAAAFDRVTNNARKAGSTQADEVIIEAIVPKGVEMLVGLKRDATFGSVVVVGMGGLWVELLADVALRLCPISQNEALAMLRTLKGIALLSGGRGQPPADVDALAQIVATVSELGAARDDILELDINPVIVGLDGAIAVDAHIEVRK